MILRGISIWFLLISFSLFSQKEIKEYYPSDSTNKIVKSIIHVDNSNPNILQGTYTEYYFSGGVKVKGEYANGNPVGSWDYFYENQKKKIALVFKDSIVQYKTSYFEDGSLKSVGWLKNGIQDSSWIFYYEKGIKKSEGSFKNGQKEGAWSYFSEDGRNKASGFFIEGKGTYREYFDNGVVKSEGTINKEWSEGVWKYYYPSGQLKAVGLEIAGSRNGAWVFYHENGTISSQGEYLNGKEVGEWNYFYENGNLSSEGKFDNGKKDDHWKLYHQEGGLKADVMLSQGTGVYKEYYDNGKIKIEGYLKDDLYHGKWMYYSVKGELEGECVYDKGYGIYNGYYSNGNLQMKGPLHNGEKSGLWEYYDKDGKVTARLQTVYDEKELLTKVENPTDGLIDTLPNSKLKPDYKFKEKSQFQKFLERSYHFKPVLREYNNAILSIDPLGLFFGGLALSAEYYWQERLGYEFRGIVGKSPLLTSFKKIPSDNFYYYSTGVSFRQKLYFRKKDVGIHYWSHGFSYYRLQFGFNAENKNIYKPLVQNRYQYMVFGGTKILKGKSEPGFTIDFFGGIGVGLRFNDWKTLPNYVVLPPGLQDVNEKNFFVPVELGVNIGYLF